MAKKSRTESNRQVSSVWVGLTGQVHRYEADLRTAANIRSGHQSQILGKDFSFRISGLPGEKWQIMLTCAEFHHPVPGRQSFDVIVNGERAIEGLDVVGEVGPKGLYSVTINTVAKNGFLEIRFRATKDYAIVNGLRLESKDAVVEIPCGDRPLPEGPQPSPARKVLPELYETSLGKLGSRILINPRPQDGIWHHSPLGSYYGEYRGLILGTRYKGRVRILPFSGRYPVYSEIDQEVTPTSIKYTAKPRLWPFEVDFKFIAPFCPRQITLSTAPYLYLDITVRPTSSTPVDLEVLIGQSLRPDDRVHEIELHGMTGFSYDCQEESLGVIRSVPQTREGTWAWATEAGPEITVTNNRFIPGEEWRFGDQSEGTITSPVILEDGRRRLSVNTWPRYSGITWNVHLNPDTESERNIVAASWVADPILNVLGEDYRFRYHEDFDGLNDVIEYAKNSRSTSLSLTSSFESTICDVPISPSFTELASMAFQSWIMNTWWAVNADGDDWFSVWEGVCKIHSTVDVCYNESPFYYHYWPELLRMQIDAWPRFVRQPNIIAHDCGPDHQVNGIVIGLEMPIEENTNFILLLHHYWRTTGDGETVKNHWPLVVGLLDYIRSCDRDGDGFATEGHYNTYEPKIFASIGAKKQSYIAFRSLAAETVGAEMADFMDSPDVADACRKHASVTGKTLDETAWLGDHFAVCLQKEIDEKQVETRTGTDLMAGKSIKGWDSFSTLTTMGLMFPLRSATKLPLPSLDQVRLDVVTSAERCVTHAGHSQISNSGTIWFSQNLFRDSIAAYLGLDMLFNVEMYWKAQRRINQQREYVSIRAEEPPEPSLRKIWREGGCWTDALNVDRDSCGLERYPRGVACFGLVWALGRLVLDQVEGTLSVAPLRWPTRIPLPMFADWAAGKVPWIECNLRDGKPHISVSHKELLPDIKVELREESVRIW